MSSSKTSLFSHLFNPDARAMMWVLTGPPACGKSVMMSQIMKEYQDYFTGNSVIYSYNADFRVPFGSRYEVLPFDTDHVEAHVQKLHELATAAKGKPFRSFIVFDDCLRGSLNTAAVRNLLSCHKKLGCTVIFVTHSIQNLAPGSCKLLRHATDYALMFSTPLHSEQQALYSTFGDISKSLDEFKEKLSDRYLGDGVEYADKHSCLFFNSHNAFEAPFDKAYSRIKAPCK